MVCFNQCYNTVNARKPPPKFNPNFLPPLKKDESKKERGKNREVKMNVFYRDFNQHENDKHTIIMIGNLAII